MKQDSLLLDYDEIFLESSIKSREQALGLRIEHSQPSIHEDVGKIKFSLCKS